MRVYGRCVLPYRLKWLQLVAENQLLALVRAVCRETCSRFATSEHNYQLGARFFTARPCGPKAHQRVSWPNQPHATAPPVAPPVLDFRVRGSYADKSTQVDDGEARTQAFGELGDSAGMHEG